MIQFNLKIHPELYNVHFKLGDTINVRVWENFHKTCEGTSETLALQKVI